MISMPSIELSKIEKEKIEYSNSSLYHTAQEEEVSRQFEIGNSKISFLPNRNHNNPSSSTQYSHLNKRKNLAMPSNLSRISSDLSLSNMSDSVFERSNKQSDENESLFQTAEDESSNLQLYHTVKEEGLTGQSLIQNDEISFLPNRKHNNPSTSTQSSNKNAREPLVIPNNLSRISSEISHTSDVFEQS